MNKAPLILKLEKVSRKVKLENKIQCILLDIDLEVPRGSFLAVVGPSGAGKSTLLNIMGLLDRPQSGRVFFQGVSTRDLTDTEESVLRNRSVGFVFQSCHLISEFNVLENVMLPALIAGETRANARKKALSLLEFCDMSSSREERVGFLSGGECQRVSLCRALINEPALLLADEPCGSLDQKNARLVEDYLISLTAKSTTTVVVATHDELTASKAHNKVALLDGKIVD